MTKRMIIYVREKDRERAELIQLAYGGSLSNAFRMGLVALCQKLGIEQDNEGSKK